MLDGFAQLPVGYCGETLCKRIRQTGQWPPCVAQHLVFLRFVFEWPDRTAQGLDREASFTQSCDDLRREEAELLRPDGRDHEHLQHTLIVQALGGAARRQSSPNHGRPTGRINHAAMGFSQGSCEGGDEVAEETQ